MALINKLTAIADAIRGKTGKTEEMTLDQMVTEIEGIQTGGGGDTTVEDGLVTRTLTEYANDRVTTIGNYAFAFYTVLEKVSFPNVVEFTGGNNFNGCSNLKEIYFPKLENASNGNAFRSCKALTEARFPSYSNVKGAPSFQDCTKLELVDFEGIATINAVTFSNCAALKVVIIRSSPQGKFTTLNNTNAFNGTPFASGGTGGTVYCPAALITQYQQATNWSTLYAAGSLTFAPIEGSEYE